MKAIQARTLIQSVELGLLIFTCGCRDVLGIYEASLEPHRLAAHSGNADDAGPAELAPVSGSGGAAGDEAEAGSRTEAPRAGAGGAAGHDAGSNAVEAAGAGAGGSSTPSTPPVQLVTGYTASGALKGMLFGNGAVNIGREFHVTASGITLRELGIWDEGANGLSAAHRVTLFAVSHADAATQPPAVELGSVVVPAGTAAELSDGFRFARLETPIDVAAGDYAIVAYGMNEQDPYGDYGNVPLATTGISDAQFDPFEFTTADSPAFPAGGDMNAHTSASFRYDSSSGKFARIMPLGDSLTIGDSASNAGYRGSLGARLTLSGFAYQFVGTARDNPGDLSPDELHHEGHTGYLIAGDGQGTPGLADQIDAWLGPTGVNPDIVLLMVGTEDIDRGFDLANAGARLDALISRVSDKQLGLQPNARLIVAQIPPLADTDKDRLATAYNANLASIVARHKAAGENVTSVDMHAGLSVSDLSTDKLHPNSTGYGKMAELWFKAIIAPHPQSHW